MSMVLAVIPLSIAAIYHAHSVRRRVLIIIHQKRGTFYVIGKFGEEINLVICESVFATATSIA